MVSKRSYGDGCPAAHALDLVGERWALLVVRELLLGPKRFTDLRAGIPNASPNVLAERLRELERAGVLQRAGPRTPTSRRVYELTEWGRELEPVVLALARWGSRSPHLEFRPSSVASVVTALRGNIDPTLAPEGQYLLHIDGDSFQLRVCGGRVALTRGEGGDPDAVLRIGSATLGAILAGRETVADAEADGRVLLSGHTAALARVLALAAPRSAIVPEPAAALS